MGRKEKAIYHFGPFSVDSQEQILRCNEEPVPLSPKVFDTLLVLVENSGRLLTKEDLMSAVWPDTFVEESNLTVNISALRKALGEHDYVETVPRRGYRFRSGVIVRERTCVIIEEELEERPAAGTLAVLPFKLLNHRGEDEYLGLGMADALITRLSNIRQVVVRPTSAVSRYTSLEQDPAEVCRELRVEAVLEGSVRREGSRLRVRVQLVSARDSRAPLWAEQVDEEFAGILALEDSISERVAGVLATKMTSAERQLLTKRHTENVEAYHHYLKGLYHASKAAVAHAETAIEHFRRAIEIDPHYALAYSGIADAYCFLSHFELAPGEAMPQARAAALKSLELDDHLAEAHYALALVEMWHGWDWPEVERRFKRALDLNNNHVSSHQWYGFYLTAMGRFDEAIVELERAQTLDPLSLLNGAVRGWCFYFARRFDQAMEQFRKVIEMDANFYTAYWGLGWAHDMSGEPEEAIAQFRKALALSDGSVEVVAGLAHAYAARGERAQAEMLLRELQERSHQRYVSPFYQALIYAGLEEKDKAIEFLERAYEDRFEWLVQLNVDPPFDSLRSDPRFTDLLRRLGHPR